MNTHPFDLVLARDAQWPLVTRNGCKAQVLKWDAKPSEFPLIGFWSTSEDHEESWSSKGSEYGEHSGESNRDLFLSADYTDCNVRAAVQRAYKLLSMEVKWAAKDGVQFLGTSDQQTPFWHWDTCDYRLAQHVPPKPKWQLPAPPAGQRWHRKDFCEADLPEGWRPLLMGETPQPGDEWLFDKGEWKQRDVSSNLKPLFPDGMWAQHRTRRPLPSAPVMVPWDSPEDVPGPVCWIRNSQRTNWMVLAVCPNGLHYTGGSYACPLKWRDINSEYQHSTDRKEWKPCTKEKK